MPYLIYISTIGLLPSWSWPFIYVPLLGSRAKSFDSKLRTLCTALIAKARSGDLDAKCLLSVAANSKHSDGKPWLDSEVFSNVQHFLLAGHETTANTLTFAFHLLSQHPEAQSRARDEVKKVCGPKGLTFECLEKLPYVWAIFREALRMHPTVPVNIRQATQDVVVGGQRVHRGEVVVLNIWTVTKDETLFPQAESFRPERWLEADGSRKAGDAYQLQRSFGGGVRKCIGQRFAEEESVLILATALLKFDSISPKSHEGIVQLPITFNGITLIARDVVTLKTA